MAVPAAPPTFNELRDLAVLQAFGAMGYLTDAGKKSQKLLADTLFTSVSQALVETKTDRKKIAILRPDLTKKGFPKVPGPEAWPEQESPELASAVYREVDQACWRACGTEPGGILQKRLNSEYGVVLCQTKVNPHGIDAVYVTRDLGCLEEDGVKPRHARQKKQAERDAIYMEMLIDRVSEHGERFHRDLIGGLQLALNSAKEITAGALLRIVEEDEEEDESDELTLDEAEALLEVDDNEPDA